MGAKMNTMSAQLTPVFTRAALRSSTSQAFMRILCVVVFDTLGGALNNLDPKDVPKSGLKADPESGPKSGFNFGPNARRERNRKRATKTRKRGKAQIGY
jgi:hypothetical protein